MYLNSTYCVRCHLVFLSELFLTRFREENVPIDPYYRQSQIFSSSVGVVHKTNQKDMCKGQHVLLNLRDVFYPVELNMYKILYVTPHAKTRLLSTILQNHFITDSNRGDIQL